MGAWIETRQLATYPVERDVAPLVGAWIETKAGYKSIPARIKSHPSWVRGLKLPSHHGCRDLSTVAPLVGAWIETVALRTEKTEDKSHPSWVRGLKLL